MEGTGVSNLITCLFLLVAISTSTKLCCVVYYSWAEVCMILYQQL